MVYYCWIHIPSILLGIFVSVFMSDVDNWLFSNNDIVSLETEFFSPPEISWEVILLLYILRVYVELVIFPSSMFDRVHQSSHLGLWISL